MTGGTFYRSYDGVSTNVFGNSFTSKAYPATVNDFRLDEFEVTVGRFRKFVAAWNGGWRPSAGAGKHAHLNGGSGLVDSGGATTYEQGWDPAWTANVRPTDANLSCDPAHQTWTVTAGPNENEPINCENWFESEAFCIWDGGFLPSETEWNYSASGGSEQRVYPWSTPASSTTIDCTYANYDYTACRGSLANVGSYSPKGDGKYGQTDLGGNIWEWTLDWYVPYRTPCDDCAYLSPGNSTSRVLRGDDFSNPPGYLLSSYRGYGPPETRDIKFGARCARAP